MEFSIIDHCDAFGLPNMGRKNLGLLLMNWLRFDVLCHEGPAEGHKIWEGQ